MPVFARIGALLVTFAFVCSLGTAQTERAQEMHARSGLSNFVAKASAGLPVTVAYLGGSITAQAGGYRDQTFRFLQAQFPRASFTQVDAAVSGTGSTLGAFRLQHDVLAHHPDLLFVEFTVNDSGGKLTQDSVEGIVRQTWKTDPSTDICFVYTVSSYLLPRLLEGKIADSTQAAETVAEHYHIPSVNFGVDIAARVREGTLVMQGTSVANEKGVEVFSKDGTHPFPATGHVHYTEAFERAFASMSKSPARRHNLHRMRALNRDAVDHPLVIPVDDAVHTGEWTPVSLDDPSGQMERSLPHVWVARRPGSTIGLDFEGDLVGIYGVKGPDVGNFAVSIDGGEPVTETLFDPYSTAGRYRIRTWFSPVLKWGPHHIVITLLESPVDKAKILGRPPDSLTDPSFHGNVLYIGDILANGHLLRPQQ